jgi:predicted acyl esterase
LTDEYLQQELDDGVAIIDWLARQPWGGFNGLQIAAMQPPQLKAVVSVCSTDDRYADDVHYMGGCLLGDNLSWASTMFAYKAPRLTCPMISARRTAAPCCSPPLPWRNRSRYWAPP